MNYILFYLINLQINTSFNTLYTINQKFLTTPIYRKSKKNIKKHYKHRKIKVKKIKHIKGKVKTSIKPLHYAALHTKYKKTKFYLGGDKRKIKIRPKYTRFIKYPSIPIYQVHMKLLKKIRVYNKYGFLRKKALSDFDKLVRCYHTDKVIKMDYRLLTELYRAWMYFGMPQVTVVSGCRQPPHAHKTSQHVKGKALDFKFDGISRRKLVRYMLKRNQKLQNYKLGVGFYPNSYQIHMDIRKKKGFWVDLGGPGEKAKYVESPYVWFFRNIKLIKSQKSQKLLSKN